MLDVRRLRVLREVSRQGSFSAAAESLAYTQSAVSQQIAALEREAGTRLVERGPRGALLTDAGRVLVARADAIVAQLEAAERELEQLRGLEAGRVRMVGFPSACTLLAPMAIARFRERHPGIEVTLAPAEAPDAAALLRAGEVDIALMVEGARSLAGGEAIETTALADDPMRVVLRRDHPQADRAPLELGDLAGERWIASGLFDCPDTEIFRRACVAVGFEPQVPFELNDYNAVQGFIAAGMGIAAIPLLALPMLREDLVACELVDAPWRRILACTLRGSCPGPARAAMITQLVEVGAELVAPAAATSA